MNILQGIEGSSLTIILICSEIALIVLLFIFASIMVRFVFGRLVAFPFLQKYLGRSARVRNRIKGVLIFLCILFCLMILGGNGFLVYKEIDVYPYTLSILSQLSPPSWGQFFTSLATIIGLIILTKYIVRLSLRLFVKIQEWAKAYDHLKSNDESIDRFFVRLGQLLKNSLWLLVLLYACHVLFFPQAIVLNLFVALKIYLIISIGILVVEAIAAVVDSLEALSNKYWYRKDYLDWYNRLSGLIPLFRRCLEYIIYVWVASLVVMQFSFIAQFASFGQAVVQIIGIFFLTRVLVEITNLLIPKYMLKPNEDSDSQQKQTLIPIIKTLSHSVIYFVAFVMMLRILDINPLPLLAGAGILGIVVGMGAQPLINDIVSGFFILFESIFLIDDYIETDSARGLVEAIHLRTTRVRDPNGQLHILRNGQINSVVNYSKEYTFAVVEVGVAYDSDLDHVSRILEETGRELQENNQNVLEPLKVSGLKEFGESELLIRTITKVRPGCHFRVAFEAREMIKKAFDREGIEIPFARRVLIFKNGKESEAKKEERG